MPEELKTHIAGIEAALAVPFARGLVSAMIARTVSSAALVQLCGSPTQQLPVDRVIYAKQLVQLTVRNGTSLALTATGSGRGPQDRG
jgi:hypothetical protein